MMDRKIWVEKLQRTAPKVHCLTNPVTMQDVANVLLAAGGTAIMAQNPAEVQEITAFCQVTLLNTGVPDEEKFKACGKAGRKANELGHPVVLDPVGVGASSFRRNGLETLLKQVRPSVIRCNQEEASALLHIQSGTTGGVESGVSVAESEQLRLAEHLARAYGCTALVSGEADAVSDGEHSAILTGGDVRIARITGSGCMLSALCALMCGAGLTAYDAACTAGQIWKASSTIAGRRTDRAQAGIGSFHVHLLDAVDWLCRGGEEEEV